MNQSVEEFKCVAKKRWEYLECGNSKKGNDCFHKLSAILDAMKQAEELELLGDLLKDEDDGVRYEAASKLLSLNHQDAVETLEELVAKNGMIPFCAEQTLKWWRERLRESKGGQL